MKQTGIVIANIDDLRDFKYKLHQMERGHQKFSGHDWTKCPECNRISELRAVLASNQRKRTAWLAKTRMEDRKNLNNMINRINNFKRARSKL